jgi:sulfur-oxidizing protein SoxY
MAPSTLQPASTRRQLLFAGLAACMIDVRPAVAAAEDLRAAIDTFAAGAPVREGRVELEIAPLVENGNAVPISVRVASAMSEAEHVVAIAVFNERNPQREVAQFALGPRTGRAQVSTRIRLATSQQLVALAKLNDGSVWSHSVDVVVTLAACVE